MHKIDMVYESHLGVRSTADITVLAPGELPGWMFPGCRVAVIGESCPSTGLSVTNGAGLIATHLLRDHGVSVFNGGVIYLEHYTQGNDSDALAARKHHPSFDVVRFRWDIVRCKPPYRLEARLDEIGAHPWAPVPMFYYPPLLRILDEPIPPWIWKSVTDGMPDHDSLVQEYH